MQEFRRFVRGPVGKVLLAAIILPFVISGFYGYFTGGSDGNIVAEVEGKKISRRYVSARVERVRNMLREQSPNINPDMLDSFVRPQMVLEGVVNEQLILAAADQADMTFGTKQAARTISDTELFSENGTFSREKFERELRSRGMNPETYLQGLREDLIKKQYQNGFVQTDFALPAELDEQRRLGEQKRDIRYVKLDQKQLRQNFSVSDEQVKAFYQNNQAEFMRPERFNVSYVELNADDYLDQVTVSDQDVQDEYQARRTMMEQSSAGGGKRVAHVLIAVGGERNLEQAQARAQQARKALADGQSFAEVAKTYSDDVATANQGGDLGRVSRGALPEPLEDALASMEAGDVSDPVTSDAGVHLLKMESSSNTARELPSFEDLASQIRSDLAEAKSQSLLNEDVATLDELLYEHSDLQTPAEQVGTPVQRSDWFSLGQAPAPLNNPKVQKELNSDAVRNQNHNSNLVELSPGHYLAVRIVDQREPEPLPLDQVAASIRERIKSQKAAEQAKSIADKARNAVQEGQDLKAVASLFEADIQTEQGLQRGSSQPAMEVVSDAFAASRPQDGDNAVTFTPLGNGSVIAFELTRVEDGNVDALSDSQKKAALVELGNVEGQRNFRQIIALLREEGDITLYPKRLDPDSNNTP